MLTLPRCVAVTLLTAVATLAQIPTGPQTRVFQDGVSGGASGVTQAAVIHDSGGDGSVTEGATLTLGSGRALIGFPRVLGTGPDQVTPGANISSATLEVWVESVPGAAATRTLTLLPLFDISGQGPWHEPQAPVTNASGAGVSWLSRDGRPGIGAPWLIAGGDAAVVPAPYSATATVDQTPGQWVSFDVTTVAGLIAEGWSNLGWSLDSDQPGDDVVLSSDEATDPTRRPRLTVNWSSLVVGANDVPAADDHQLTTTEGAPVLLQLPFVDGDGQLVQYVIREWPQNGTLEGQTWWVYKPAPGFIGTDTFTYYAHDGFASSPIGTVTITVGPDAAATTSTYASGAAGTAGEVRSATIPVTSSPTGQVTNVGPEIVVAQGRAPRCSTCRGSSRAPAPSPPARRSLPRSSS